MREFRSRSIASPGQSYYFSLLPKKIQYIGSSELLLTYSSYFKIVLFKGTKKFTQTIQPIPALFNEHGQLDCAPLQPLYFYLPNFDKTRKATFRVNLYLHNQEQVSKVGELSLDINPLIQTYETCRTNYIPEQVQISANYQFQYELLIQKSKPLMQLIIEERTNPVSFDVDCQTRTEPKQKIKVPLLPIRKDNFFNPSQIYQTQEDLQRGIPSDRQMFTSRSIQNFTRTMSRISLIEFTVDASHCEQPALKRRYSTPYEAIEMKRSRKTTYPSKSMENDVQRQNGLNPEAPLKQSKYSVQKKQKIKCRQGKDRVRELLEKMQNKNNIFILVLLVVICLILGGLLVDQKMSSPKRRKMKGTRKGFNRHL